MIKENNTAEYTEEEIEGKLNKVISLFKNAVNIVKKHIDRITQENKEDEKWLLDDLNVGLTMLIKRVEYYGAEDGKEKIKMLLTRPKGCRYSTPFSRYFGEFLWKDEKWQNEITDAVHDIEHYFNDM